MKCNKITLEIYLQFHLEDELFRMHCKQYQYCIILLAITLTDFIRHIVFIIFKY